MTHRTCVKCNGCTEEKCDCKIGVCRCAWPPCQWRGAPVNPTNPDRCPSNVSIHRDCKAADDAAKPGDTMTFAEAMTLPIEQIEVFVGERGIKQWIPLSERVHAAPRAGARATFNFASRTLSTPS